MANYDSGPIQGHAVVSHDEWLAARRALLEQEKAFNKRRDELTRARRAIPWERVAKPYAFDTLEGRRTLADLFDGRRQLLVYHFMFAPDVSGWPAAGCPGCSMVVDHIGPLEHLHARDTSLVLVSLAPLANLEAYKQRMGWKVPWYSSAGTTFNADFGVSTDEGETFGLSVFLRDGDAIYHTYFTSDRGIEVVVSSFTLLDWTPFGRQETWEDSPPGWPQSEPYIWWRRHDEY